MSPQDVLSWLVDLPLRWKVLGFATAVVLIELAFRHWAPRSLAYARWTRFFQGIGVVWTTVILAVIYILSVGPIGLVMRVTGHDPLDRRIQPEGTLWKTHEPNPLGPERAARHQF